jgi:uncharacterized protein (DUF488 family)
MSKCAFTIGHSNHSIERFLELLAQHDISAIGDVRSSPFSRMNPQYNRENLKTKLASAKIAYVFLGKELGARPEDRSCYRNNKVVYELLAETELFKRGLERVSEGADSYRIALLCAEKNPINCHRAILVSRKLTESGVQVLHILEDGNVDDHGSLEQRMMGAHKLLYEDMFRSYEERLAAAYALQGEQIAYEDESDGEREQQ